MAETISDRIVTAIRGENRQREAWLDPEDILEIADDVARALGFEPDDALPEAMA